MRAKPALNRRKNDRRIALNKFAVSQPTIPPAIAIETAAVQGRARTNQCFDVNTTGSTWAAFTTQGVAIGPRKIQPSAAPATRNASRGNGGACPLFCGRNNRAVSAGLSVSELKAEMMVETAIVTANCRKNWPVIPEMKAHGTKTALSTRPTAITGPETCS